MKTNKKNRDFDKDKFIEFIVILLILNKSKNRNNQIKISKFFI